MIKDITIGQYFPGNSVIHRMDARIKIIMTAVFIVMLFAANSVWGLLVGIAFTILTFIISKIPGKLMLKSLKPIVPIIIFTAILNLLFIRTGKAYFEWKFLKITDEGVDTAVFMMIRIICLIVGTSLLTYTTSPIDLTENKKAKDNSIRFIIFYRCEDIRLKKATLLFKELPLGMIMSVFIR